MRTSAKYATAFVVAAPFVAILMIPFILDELAIPGALIQLPIWYFLTGQAVTVSLHRELTHCSLRLKPIARYTEAFLGLLALEGPILAWCARHRKHHRHTDKDGDPHSPHRFGEGTVAIMKGFVHAHLGWLFREPAPEYRKYVPDLLKDRGLVRLDRIFGVCAVLTFVLPGLFTLLFEPTLRGFVAGVFWGGFVRIFFVHHVTWSTNSVCHLWGTRPFRSRDQSTNHWIFGILGLGEGWHRNHHAFPRSSRIGLRLWEIDGGWMIIKLLDFLGLVEWLRLPSAGEIEAKRI